MSDRPLSQVVASGSGCSGPLAPLVATEEEYLERHGVGLSALGEPAMHKLPGVRESNRRRLIARQAGLDHAWSERRAALRREYRERVAAGTVRPPTRQERMVAVARGHEDRESVQAARRVCLREGWSW